VNEERVRKRVDTSQGRPSMASSIRPTSGPSRTSMRDGGRGRRWFATADALLMGRVLYNEWAAYWPEHADQPFGDVMNWIKKYVISNGLQTAE
jgi:hypothetical protein